MALLTANAVVAGSSTAVSFTAATAGGDTVSYNANKQQMLVVKNDHTAAQNTTVTARRTAITIGTDVFTRASITTAVAANGGIRIFPLTEAFVDDNGVITITYSAVTALSVALVEY